MAYYKKIKGRNYDGDLLKIADSVVKGRGDGRISLTDAKKILKTVKDSEDYTDVEKSTMQYIRDNYTFTAEANTWFRTEVRKWAATKGAGGKKKPAGAKSTAGRGADKTAPVRDEPSHVHAHGHAAVKKVTGKESGWGRKLLLTLVAVVILILAVFIIRPLKDFFFGPGVKVSKPDDLRTAGQMKEPDALKAPEQAAPREDKKTPEPVKETAIPEKGIYVVREKDNLIKIAEELTGDYRNWEKIFEANRDTIPGPAMIFVGQKLKIPEGINRK
jgi:hypothetical protein